ncbi:hypothetical protein [Aureimonas mangrovi]|uniref:hypothetical protein n=1 Tax=Aureimonas mangrovi TaxID=2758041 RepID=UPI00163DBE10|nr:hypothetical protein [Aureimonas mangrovi]
MKTIFAHCLAACGLSLDDAVVVLGQSRSAVGKKSQGVREMTPGDAKALSALWHRIRTGDTDGLPEGAAEMATALRILRGVDGIAERKPGRKRRSQRKS